MGAILSAPVRRAYNVMLGGNEGIKAEQPVRRRGRVRRAQSNADLTLGNPNARSGAHLPFYLAPLAIASTAQLLWAARHSEGYRLPAIAAAILAATGAVLWHQLPEVSDKALVDAENVLLQYAESEWHRRWTHVETSVGGWNVHSMVFNQDKGTEHMVLIHGHSAGVGVYCKVIDRLLEAIGPKYVLHVIDMPGWGRSHAPNALQADKNPDAVINMYVDMLEGWREANDIEHFTMLAHSWGAFLGVHYAARFEARVDHLIFASPAGCLTVMPFDQVRAGLGFKWLTPQRFAGMFGRLGLVMFRSMYTYIGDDVDPEMCDYYYQMAAACSRRPGSGDRAFSRFISYTLTFTSSHWNRPCIGTLLSLGQHITLIFGEKDPLVPARYGKFLHSLRPKGMNLFTITNAGHNPAHCRPEAFCGVVKRALALYEERLKLEATERARDAQHTLVQPKCIRCHKPVSMHNQHLKCACATVHFAASPSEKATSRTAAHMQDTFRRLFVEQSYHPSELDPELANVTHHDPPHESDDEDLPAAAKAGGKADQGTVHAVRLHDYHEGVIEEV